jgi:hypothetical protein
LSHPYYRDNGKISLSASSKLFANNIMNGTKNNAKRVFEKI